MRTLTADRPVALVAGASRGIGADTARAFAGAGYAVVLGARDARRAWPTSSTTSTRAAAAPSPRSPTSVTTTRSAALVALRASTRFGRLDAAFNNATDGPMPAPLADIDPDEFDSGIRTNVRGTFLGMKYQIPAMLGSGGGADRQHGVGRRRAGDDEPRRLRRRQGRRSSGSPRSRPSTTPTAASASTSSPRADPHPPPRTRPGPRRNAWPGQSVPMRRVGTTAEVADVVLWLCSARSRRSSPGPPIPIDGGQLAGHKPPQMYRQGEGMAPTPVGHDGRPATAQPRGGPS